LTPGAVAGVFLGVVGNTGTVNGGSGVGLSSMAGTRVRLGAFQSTAAAVAKIPRTTKMATAKRMGSHLADRRARER
jgi:hypothetical protein